MLAFFLVIVVLGPLLALTGAGFAGRLVSSDFLFFFSFFYNSFYFILPEKELAAAAARAEGAFLCVSVSFMVVVRFR